MAIVALIAIAWLLSSNRKAIRWKLVAGGLLLQIVLASLILGVSYVRDFFYWLSKAFVSLLQFSNEGARFLFGDLASGTPTFGKIFAFQVLPTIIFFSALSAMLYHLGVLQRVVKVMAWVMKRFMHISGAESLAAAANVFIGQTEAPLVIKPYLKNMTRSELLCLMTGGMATIAGGVMAVLVTELGHNDPVQMQEITTHFLTASIMSAPAAILLAKILIPETENIEHELKTEVKTKGNMLETIAQGTTDGVKLAVNVGGMLLVFIALMALLNYILQQTGRIGGLNQLIFEWTNGAYDKLSLHCILGVILSPVAWLLGVSSSEMMAAGQLLGEKTIFNEFLAYLTMDKLEQSGQLVNKKSIVIMTYALCGFSNFSSIGIQIGGIGALVPERRKEIAALGIKALIAGTLACLLTASIAGMFFS